MMGHLLFNTLRLITCIFAVTAVACVWRGDWTGAFVMVVVALIAAVEAGHARRERDRT